MREFGSKGPEGVSTREIATAAGTAMSSITYHYGGKDGLYLAAADHIAGQMEASMAPAFACEQLPADPDGARVCVHRVLEQFLRNMLVDADADLSLFVLREQMNPTAAFDRLYDGPMGRLAERLVSQVALATGTARPLAEVTAMLLFGQVIVWRSSRAMAARVLDGPADAWADIIRQQVARNTDAILDRLIADTQEPL